MAFSSSLKKAFQSATNWVSGAAKTVYGTAKPVVNQLYSDVKSVVSFAGSQINKNADVGRGLVSNLGNASAGLMKMIKDLQEWASH
jgi:phage-related protein